MMDSHKRLGIAEFVWGQGFARSSHHRARLLDSRKQAQDPRNNHVIRKTPLMRRISLGITLRAMVALGLLLVFEFAQTGLAQNAPPFPLPLSLENNYLVSGDYVVGGWVITPGTSDGITTTGTITIPDPMQPVQNGVVRQVPQGADIVAAFLYWGTVESTGTFAGKQAFFRGYSITGTPLGNLMAPVSWSTGGCVGAANGSKTMQIYRADVRALLPVDANGKTQPNAAHEVKLADTGKNTPPFPLGATLVMVYRILAPEVPLNAVVIYDGAFAPSNQSQIVTQPMIGFYQPAASPMAKLTHIVGNGQSNKLQTVSFHGQPLPGLYPTFPNFPNVAFPGVYNNSWDNVTWNVSSLVNGSVPGFDTSETTVVTPSQSNKGCVNWGAIIFSTTVQDSDQDGLLDVWKTNQGYCDAGAFRGMSNQGTCPTVPMTNDPSWVALPGAQSGSPGNPHPDVFVQVDYMCTKVIHNADGTITCDTANGGISYAPSQQALDDVTSAFSANGHNIHVHFATDNNHVILAQTCTDSFPLSSPPVYCPYPGQAGVVRWKAGFDFLKNQPLNYPDETSCETQTPPGQAAGTGPLCVRRFQPGGLISRHELIFGVASGVPNWRLVGGTLTGVAVPAPGVVTFTTSTPHGLVPATSINDTNPNARVTVSGAISNPSLNRTFLVQNCPVVTSTCFAIQDAQVTTAPTKSSDPSLVVASGKVGTGSGLSDIGGANSLVTLVLWGADATLDVQKGTIMHELGHALGLTHGGFDRVPFKDGSGYSFTFEPNCKPNFQSVMNYMHQVDLLDTGVPGAPRVLDYSEQELSALDESSLPAGVTAMDGSPLFYPTTKWYTPNQPGGVGSAATRHCPGTPLAATDPNPTMYRVEGPANPITPAWVTPSSDVNFDGEIEQCSTCLPPLPPLHGYNDWANIDLRQIGATGNDFWAGGDIDPTVAGGDLDPTLAGGEQDFKTASSTVRTPTSVIATLNSSSSAVVTWTPPTLFQSLITGFNIYRSKNGGPFSQLPPTPTVSVPSGTPLPLSTTFKFTDSTASCGTFTYFVTTVITDTTGITGTIGTRESVPSNTSNPISVPCIFVGFLQPLSTASSFPTAPTFSGAVNQNSAVPVKWELMDGNGNFISDLSTLQFMQACPTTGANVPPPAAAVCVPIFANGTPKGNSTFRFSSPQFIFNWDTKSTIGTVSGFWTIELQLSDGSAVKWTNIQF